MLTAGDKTEIGEKRINLSGGQKQHVSLPRACHSDYQLYMFDDCLSAADSHAANHIFNHCFINLSRENGKTVIFATHTLSFLRFADNIVAMNNDGTIKMKGTLNELENSDINLMQFIVKRDKDKGNQSGSAIDDSGKLIEEEQRGVGDISLKVYKDYLKAAGGIALFGFIVFWYCTYNLANIFATVMDLLLTIETSRSDIEDDDEMNINEYDSEEIGSDHDVSYKTPELLSDADYGIAHLSPQQSAVDLLLQIDYNENRYDDEYDEHRNEYYVNYNRDGSQTPRFYPDSDFDSESNKKNINPDGDEDEVIGLPVLSHMQTEDDEPDPMERKYVLVEVLHLQYWQNLILTRIVKVKKIKILLLMAILLHL